MMAPSPYNPKIGCQCQLLNLYPERFAVHGLQARPKLGGGGGGRGESSPGAALRGVLLLTGVMIAVSLLLSAWEGGS